ncbi:MAG: DNA replication/repair protein RecF [Treponema sp.]|nr:DNA replication/repair protein RecF [Treponema sp.]
MPFLSLSPVHFRNLRDCTIDLLAKEVYFTGENGQGKSNLLEALYYSSYGSSFRTRVETELIRKGEVNMSLRTMYREENGVTHSTFICLDKGKKRIEKDGKTLHDRKELINTMPCVLYNHDDLDFAVGEPERRRFFIDQSLSMYDVLYIDVMRRYKKILKSRNLCLKEHNYSLFGSYDIQLVMNGLEIQKKRRDAVFQFNQIFGRMYEEISGIEGVSIRYSPSWKKTPSDEAEESYEQNFLPQIDEVLDMMKSKLESEKVTGTTLTGPHRDRIIFMKDNHPFVPTASTGQRRLIALVLRTAQAVFYTQVTQKKPVLLMDDVMLELDPAKRQKLTSMLPPYDQLFCTFLPGEPYQSYMHEGTRVYKITDGTWEEEKR